MDEHLVAVRRAAKTIAGAREALIAAAREALEAGVDEKEVAQAAELRPAGLRKMLEK